MLITSGVKQSFLEITQARPQKGREKQQSQGDLFISMFSNSMNGIGKEAGIGAVKEPEETTMPQLAEEDDAEISAEDVSAVLAAVMFRSMPSEAADSNIDIASAEETTVLDITVQESQAVLSPESELPIDAAAREDIPENPVTSILEGKTHTDIDVQQQPATDSLPVQTAVTEQTARMPQSGSLETPAMPKDATNVAESGSADDLCPLENESDKLTVNSAESEEPEKSGDLLPRNAEKTEEPKTADGVVVPQQAMDIAPMKVESAEQMKAEIETKPIEAENLFEKLVESIEISKSEGTNRLELQLKPEHLGKVTVSLTLVAGELQARIQAEDAGVRNAINSQASALVEALSEKGVKVSAIEVLYTGIDSNTFSEPGQNGEAFQNNGGRRAVKNSGFAGLDSLMTEEESPIIEAGLSSVEYRA